MSRLTSSLIILSDAKPLIVLEGGEISEPIGLIPAQRAIEMATLKLLRSWKNVSGDFKAYDLHLSVRLDLEPKQGEELNIEVYALPVDGGNTCTLVFMGRSSLDKYRLFITGTASLLYHNREGKPTHIPTSAFSSERLTRVGGDQ